MGQHDWTTVQNDKKWNILFAQKRFALWAIYSSIGCMMMGFDFSNAGTITAFSAFQQVMGKPYPGQASGYLISASIQSAWNGVATAGDIFGVMVSGQVLDRIGRKHSIFFGIIFTAVGIGMQYAAHEWKLFLGGRLVNSIGFGIVYVVAPVWIGETVRPELRGLFLCVNNCSIVFGQFILALVAYGAQKIEGRWSYEVVILVQFAFVFALLVVYPFFPESPYHLLKNNNEARARQMLQRIHGSGDQGLIDAEVIRMNEGIAVARNLEEQANLHGPLILQCFKGNNLKRTLIAMLAVASQQLIGASFVLGYITYFLDLIGVSNYFTVSVVLYVIMLLSNLTAFPFIEIFGRRPLLLFGMLGLTAVLLLMGIMGFVKTSGAVWVVLVCIFLWAIIYQLTIGAIGFALAYEVATPQLRPMTASIVGFSQGAAGWVIGFVVPYMINPDAGNLGAKVGLVFAGLGVPLCIAFWFMIPETKGLGFNDLDYMFNAKVKPRHFKRVFEERQAAEADSGDLKNETVTTQVEAV
ncbi:hypothetical protein SEUCBS140593_006783 [Sporothrix eucalyptigena]|uniref:Major facilitator superfamily (MFS) profile domain-containing protein n=1 Tax=Sporothrix eucalyptigena TaxID=1812306 RepID=A0ABP0C8T0_9PEZI